MPIPGKKCLNESDIQVENCYCYDSCKRVVEVVVVEEFITWRSSTCWQQLPVPVPDTIAIS